MIWFTIGLFFVSFLLTALLTPKPEFENARAEGLDPNNFPRATEDDPIPLLLGCARIKGPNTLWYGGYRARPIRETVKTGLFSKDSITVGHSYYLTYDLGLCLGPDVRLRDIYIDDVLATPGDDYYSGGQEDNILKGGDGILPGPTYHSAVFGSSWATLQGDTDVVIDLLDIFPNQAAIDAAFDQGEFDFTLQIAGYVNDRAIVGGPKPGQANKAFQIGLFQDNGSDLPDYSNPIQVKGSTQLDTGYFNLTFRWSSSPGGTTTANNIRFVCCRVAIYLASWQTIHWMDDMSDTPTGSHRQILTVEHNWVDIISSDINKRNLFGGYKSGGGYVGNFTFYNGSFNQDVDAVIEAKVGSGNVPAYVGVSHIVFDNNYIGETPALRKMEFLLDCYTNNISNGYGGRIGIGADDIDPAEAIYTILTDRWKGLSVDPDDIDLSTFQDASTTLISENNGCSLVVSSPQNGKKVITEILRQIDGILYQDGASGQIKLKLIREDYTPAALTVYDEDDIIKVTNFSKTAWGDVKSEVRVSFSNRDSQSSRVAIAQDMAIANMMGSRQISEISFPFCYSKSLANKLAARELSLLSTPLFRMTVQMNRNGYALAPADVIKISWPEYGLSEVIMRVQKVDLGSLMDGKIVVELVQDVFASSAVVLADPVDSSWVDDRPVPQTIATQAVVEMPYFYSSRLEYPVPDGYGDIIPFAIQPQTSSLSYSLLSSTNTGALDIYEPYGIFYPLSAQIDGEYSRLTGFETGLDTTGITIDNVVGGDNPDAVAPVAATTAQIRLGEDGIIYANGEWMAYEGVTDNGSGSYTLTNVRRALFGTMPVSHSDNSVIYFLKTEMLGKGNKAGLLEEDGTLYYKMLDQVGPEMRDPSDETELSITLADIADRPLRPRLLSIDAARSEVPWDAAADPDVDLTWETSNRAEGQVTFEDDADGTPDQTEQYDLEVWIDGVQDMSLSDDNITQPYALDLSSASGSVGELRLYSKRTGGDTKSSVYYAWYPFTLQFATMDSTGITMDQTDVTMDQTS